MTKISFHLTSTLVYNIVEEAEEEEGIEEICIFGGVIEVEVEEVGSEEVEEDTSLRWKQTLSYNNGQLSASHNIIEEQEVVDLAQTHLYEAEELIPLEDAELARERLHLADEGRRFRDTTEPLSRLLNEDRPLLKIIHFVPATQNRFLFQNQEDEELLKPVVEDIGDEEEEHVPTADKVARVFSGKFERPRETDSEAEAREVEEELEEIDFADVGAFQETVDASHANAAEETSKALPEEQIFTGRYEPPSFGGGDAPARATDIQTGGSIVIQAEAITITDATSTDDVVMSVSSTIASMDIQGHDPGEPKPPPPEVSDPAPVPEQTPPLESDSHMADAPPTIISEPSLPPSTTTPNVGPMSSPQLPTGMDYEGQAMLPVESDQTEPPLSQVQPTQLISMAPEPDAVPAPPAFTIDATPQPAVEAGPSAENSTEQPLFFIDTTPTEPTDEGTSSSNNTVPLGAEDPDEDIIVYVAPNPRSGRATPQPQVNADIPVGSARSILTGRPLGEAPSVDSVSFSFSQTQNTPASSSKTKPLFTLSTRTPVSARMKHRHRTQWARGKSNKSRSFADRGIAVSDRQLWKGRGRKGDSDVDWGTDDSEWESEEEEEVRLDEVTKTLHVVSQKKKGKKKEDPGAEGMDVDPDLEFDTEAMKAFVKGIDRGYLTKEDLEAENANRVKEEYYEMESDDDESEGDEEDVEVVMDAEERELIGEDDVDEDSDDEEESPKSSFQARLDKLRKQSQKDKGKGKAVTQDFYDDLDDSDDEEYYRRKTWAEEDDDFIAEIEDLLEENADILNGRDRKARKKLFRAVRDGDFDFDDEFAFEDDEDLEEWMPKAGKRKNKSKHLPPDLAELWEADRQKKAAKKQAREMERLLAAVDPLAPKKGGKKARKFEERALALSLDNRVIDISTLVQQIRRFLDDTGKHNMSLPPCAKETRKMVHELATAFGLKSVSKGNGNQRYTTLSKTRRSAEGIVNEKKVGKVVRAARARGVEFAAGIDVNGGKGGGARRGGHKIREGDEVGKAAPKLNETNIGFRLLAGMGWAEGDRIGLQSGGQGLKDPLKAVIKNTKLGLGASRDR
ncbi:squalene synthetase-like protein [Paramarasmius palmivorus]|uniref:Squalene synthetase-like protein n=1 Tax=Paramarasmius palmivorus TaxID=297713 RepID=A0AAW0BY68_9AGAR